MAAAAPAKRTTAPRRAPAKRSAPAKRLVPVAVMGRTAGAVGGLADSGVVVRLTRGRLWIGALGALLVGIVALNVMALSFSAASSDAARQSDELKQQNSALRADLAQRLSYEQVQEAAAKLGLIVPAPGSTRYLEPSAGDAAEAAKRLRNGELSNEPAATPTVVPADPATVAPAEPVVEPATAAPTETAPAETVAPPVEATAPPVAPVETAPAPAPASTTGGGVAPQ
jgi:hypothetical protein